MGDTFEAGVIISIPDAGPQQAPVTVTATVTPPTESSSNSSSSSSAATAGSSASAATAANAAGRRLLLSRGGERPQSHMQPRSHPVSMHMTNQRRQLGPGRYTTNRRSLAQAFNATSSWGWLGAVMFGNRNPVITFHPDDRPGHFPRFLTRHRQLADVSNSSSDTSIGSPGTLAVTLLPENPYSRSTALNAAKQQMEVRFRFVAAQIGEAGLRFDAYLGDSEAPSDSASFDLTVLGRQGEVFVATSFALQGAAGGGTELGGGQVEGLDLPEADPGSGSVDLVAGVGYLPFLQVCGFRV